SGSDSAGARCADPPAGRAERARCRRPRDSRHRRPPGPGPSRCRGRAPRPPRPGSGTCVRARCLLLLELRTEVVLEPHVLDLLELRLQPVDVLFLLVEDLLEEQAAAVVALVAAERDALVETGHRLLLD